MIPAAFLQREPGVKTSPHESAGASLCSGEGEVVLRPLNPAPDLPLPQGQRKKRHRCTSGSLGPVAGALGHWTAHGMVDMAGMAGATRICITTRQGAKCQVRSKVKQEKQEKQEKLAKQDQEAVCSSGSCAS